MIPWNASDASNCRWDDEAYLALRDALNAYSVHVIWERCEVDYQGCVNALCCGNTWGTGPFALIEYSYGSCSGCDEYEDLPVLEVCNIMRNRNISIFKDMDEAVEYFKGIKPDHPAIKAIEELARK